MRCTQSNRACHSIALHACIYNSSTRLKHLKHILIKRTVWMLSRITAHSYSARVHSTHWAPNSRTYMYIGNFHAPKLNEKPWLNTVLQSFHCQLGLDWIVQCFMSPPTQYRLYGRRFLQVKRLNQQYQSTEGTYSTQRNQTYNNQTINTKHSKSPSLH